ncbi:MAG: cupin domain-containing protein [Saprospiraceae bacterium]|nr:cupin domain-containing protein [Saprospiraceae bacterium]
MHVHHLQDEHLTVVKGGKWAHKCLAKRQNSPPRRGATFKAGIPHKFWNAGTEPLLCTAWVKPAYNMEYFLTEIFKSTEANGGKRPGTFDAAYLLDRYHTEFDMLEIPSFVKKVVFPVLLFIGKLLGKQRKFEGAPEPLRDFHPKTTIQQFSNSAIKQRENLHHRRRHRWADDGHCAPQIQARH